MIQHISRLTKENFVWMPLLFLVIPNIVYLFLVAFMFFIGLTDKNLMTIQERSESPLLFIASTIIMMGWGLRFILISNGIGIGVGLLAALFIRKPFSRLWKRRIGFFLAFFYILIVGSFVFLILRNLVSFPPNPIRP